MRRIFALLGYGTALASGVIVIDNYVTIRLAENDKKSGF
jgi:hypothetical protein